MSYKEYSAFAVLFGLCCFAFAPLDAPGGSEVAIGGLVVFLIMAAVLFVLAWKAPKGRT